MITKQKPTQRQMINISTIVLIILTSLLTAVLCSPSPSPEIITKHGHPVVVVEYANEPDGTTKVSISQQNVPPAAKHYEKRKHLVSDAYGQLVKAFWKSKDTSTKTAEQVQQDAVEKTPQDVGKEAKDTPSGRLAEKLPGHTVGEFLTKAKDSVVKGLTDEAKKVAGKTTAVVKDGASKPFDIIDSPKRMGEDITRNVSGQVEESGQQVKHQAKETVRNVREVSGEGSSLNDILNKLKQVAYGDEVGCVAGLVHVVGFSTAYGMCVWVTFVSSYILGRYLPRQVFGMVQSRIYPVYFRAMGFCVSAALLGDLGSPSRKTTASKIVLFQRLSLLSALLLVLTNMILLEPKVTRAMYKLMKLEKKGKGKGVEVAVEAKDGMVDGVADTVVRSSVNGKRVRVAVNEGRVEGDDGRIVRTVTNRRGIGVADKGVTGRREELLRLNEKLKELNAYSSAVNLFTLVALTWHMAYMSQRLQA